MPRARTAPDALEAGERALRALELRKAGKTYDAIALQLGYASRSGPYEAVKSLLQRVETDAVEELRRLEGERLDWFLSMLAPAIESGDADAIAVGIRLGERRAKLMGLDAPAKLNVSASDEDQVRAYARAKQLDEEAFVAEWRRVRAEAG